MNKRQHADRRWWRAETIAALYLRLTGWRILARRRQLPMIEIDIVARRGGVLAIVEVKYRPTLDQALSVLAPYSAERLARAARQLAAEHAGRDIMVAARVDLIALAPGHFPRHIQGIV